MNSKNLYLAACLSLAPLPAGAAVIAVENFDYEDGPLAGNNGGSGWSTTWANIEGTTASVSSGSAGITSTPGSQVARTLAAPLTGDATVWIHFVGEQSTTQSGTTDSYGGFGLYSGNDERLLVGKAWPGPYEWRAGTNTGLLGADPPVSTLDLTTVLMKVTLNAVGDDTLDIWFNPGDASSETALGEARISRTIPNLSFDTIRLRGGSGAGGTESWQFDHIALGTTLADVVPEPSTAVLGGFALLFPLRRRR